MTEADKRTHKALEEIRADITREAGRTSDELSALKQNQGKMQTAQDDVLRRLSKLEMGGRASSTTASEGAPRKPAVIFGRWGANIPKVKLLKDLAEVLEKSTAKEWLDEAPWTPGPRKGIALAGFVERTSESVDDIRQRMQEVVNLVNLAASTRSTVVPVWALGSYIEGAW